MNGRIGWMALVATVALAACGGTVESDGTTAGTYELERVDGRPPPVVLSEDASGKVEVTLGTLQLLGNHEVLVGLTLRTSGSQGDPVGYRFESGTWNRKGTSISILFDTGPRDGHMGLGGRDGRALHWKGTSSSSGGFSPRPRADRRVCRRSSPGRVATARGSPLG